jgi:1-acyl-sn-glycerol-3-phosphate acyltransferase
MHILKKVLVFFFSVYAFLLLIMALILLLLVILGISFFSEKKRGDYLYAIVSRFISVFFLLTGIRPNIRHEVKTDKKSPHIFVFNHISYLDALVIVHALRGRSIRGLGKYEISTLPLIGFIYKQAVITVKRGDKEDRARSVAIMKEFLAESTSIFLAPEGTFNESDKPLSMFYDGAFRIALETRTTIQPILLLDTHDRMHYRSLFSINPGPSRVIFLPPFPVDEYSMDDLPVFKEKVFTYMQDALIQHKASWISTDI